MSQWKEIGDRLRQRREDFGLSQQRLAEIAGLTDRTSISQFEKNPAGMRLKYFVPIKEALKSPASYFFGDGSSQSREDLDLLAAFHDIEEGHRPFAMRLLRQLAAEFPSK